MLNNDGAAVSSVPKCSTVALKKTKRRGGTLRKAMGSTFSSHQISTTRMMNNNDDELNYAYENGMENNQTKTKMGKKSRNQEIKKAEGEIIVASETTMMEYSCYFFIIFFWERPTGDCINHCCQSSTR